MQNTMIEIPLVWAAFAGFVLTCVVIAKLPMSKYTGKTPPLVILQERFGLAGLNGGLFFLALLFWAVLFVLVFGGLILTIIEITQAPLPAINDAEAIWTWRFSVLKLASLTAVLGAVVALPFTLLRLSLSHQQVGTAKEALFNDKINVAVSDLYAQRQVTMQTDESREMFNGWQDDITRRNGAIDRLEGLVEEDTKLSERVARMLSVYILELSRSEAQALPMPPNLNLSEVREWTNTLSVKRSDMEKATQALGRFVLPTESDWSRKGCSLKHCNLQGFLLNNLDFRHFDFSNANLQKSIFTRSNLALSEFWFSGLQGAVFHEADLTSANLSGADLRKAQLNGADLRGATLSRAQLDGSECWSADFRDAIFWQTSLQNGVFKNASFDGANMSEAKFDPTADFEGATFWGTSVARTDLSNCPQIVSYIPFMFGDETVKLPENFQRPAQFDMRYASEQDYNKAWEDFRIMIANLRGETRNR